MIVFNDSEPEIVSDFFMPNRQKIELLQSILRAESGEDISYEYAAEVSVQLISFYECLARDKTIIPGASDAT